jgi:hypothetical protein
MAVAVVVVVVVVVVDFDGDGDVEVDATVDGRVESNFGAARPIRSTCSVFNVSTSINAPSNS